MNTKTKSTKGLQPKLRFPEFRNGGDWEEKSIGDKAFARIYKGKGISKSEIVHDGKTPCIRYGELYTHYGEVIDAVISKTNSSESGLFLSKKNDIIMPSSGETKIDIATASCVILDNVALGGDLIVIRSHHNGMFISYYLNGSLKRQIAKLAQGDAVVHLYPSQLEKVRIYLPQNKEQKKIADCLFSLDELIQAENQKLKALKQHKKGLMQKLFPAVGETVPKLRFHEFWVVGGWEEIQLHKISEPVLEKVKGTTSIIVLTLSAEYGLVYQSKYFGKKIAGENLERYIKICHNDFVYNDRTTKAFTYGTIKRLSKHTNGLVSPIYKCFRFNEHENPIFWEWYFESSTHEPILHNLINEGARAGRFNISIDKFLSTLAKRPKEDEQKKIADCLSSLDELIQAEDQKLKALKQHKKGLMQQLFPTVSEVQE